MATHVDNHPQVNRSAAAAVDEHRLWQRHMTMAGFGARPDGGVNRQALSPEDVAARRQIVQWAQDAGYACAQDPIGNLFIRREGRDPSASPVLAGSHLDSQPAGGKFDGVYGVLAGLEALHALDAAGIETERPIEVVAWTNEEGSRFAPGAMGSAAFAGFLKIDDLMAVRDRAGTLLKEALGATLAALPDLPRRALGFPVAAYVEAHIEQGPRLELARKTIGVVTGIQGARWFTVEIRGAEAHAGTTPHKLRRDAFKAAVAMIAALENYFADDQDVTRFTVGSVTVEPNSPNTVPGSTVFSIDFRHPDGALLKSMGDGVAALCAAHARGCDVKVKETLTMAPIAFDAAIVAAIDDAAESLELPRMALPSGAFHDAKFMSDIGPAGMIFVPCADGISHSPLERAASADLAAGAQVLAEVLARLARESS